MHINTVALFILLGILFEMFSLQATRLVYINRKTVTEVLITIFGTTIMYVVFLSLGWLFGKYFLKGFTLIPDKILIGAMILIILLHAIVRDRKKIASASLLYQNLVFYFGIVLAKSIMHIVSGALFYKMDLFTHVFFNWILLGTAVFSIISVTLTYPSMKIFGLSVDRLKIALYAIAFILLFFC
ncbi:MAG: hypothetical protein PHU27_05640 [Salinivirgaceae bacterium]|nr:hypothetical protein [Salinivirgaceae bacterium]MDD4746929.1 hypothetical protein [Salinivirgaceae bacterium]MDY0280206.1 hypothetical protein [Salinivirgaceae bacterium]